MLHPLLIRRLSIALLIGAVFASPAVFALVEDYQPTPTTYVIYTACMCGLLFLAVITLILRSYRWLHYALLVTGLVLTGAAASGALPYWLGGSDFALWVVPYLVISVTTGIGYWVAGAQIEATHRFVRYKKLFFGAAIGSVIGPLTSYFWLMVIPLNLMWIPQLILYYAMFIALILPPWTWPIENNAQKIATRAFPILIAITYVLVAFFEEPGDSLTGETAIRFQLAGNVIMFVYVWVLAIWLGVSAQSSRRKAERAALEASRNEAQLQLSLVNAERDYDRAMGVANASRKQLATVSHDLKQPLASLRVAVDRMAGDEELADAQALSRAVDYVDDLARSYGATGDELGVDELATDPEANEARHLAAEDVELGLLLSSLTQMFSQQAEDQGVALTMPAGQHRIHIPPLDAMRVLSNLLANALQHAQAKNIEITEQLTGDKLLVRVVDDGVGMSETELVQLVQSGSKGKASSGDGLGLAIVKELCALHDWNLKLESAPRVGLDASIRLPLAADGR